MKWILERSRAGSNSAPNTSGHFSIQLGFILSLALVSAALVSGCAHDEANIHRGGTRPVKRATVEAESGDEDNTPKTPQSEFRDKYESVWKAVQLTMAAYPIKVNDQDSGIMETDQIKGDMIWKPVGIDSRVSAGLKYSLLISAKKTTGLEGGSVIRVTITKRIENQADFFAPIEQKATDGMEEAAILYRIRRELMLDRLLLRTNRG